MKSKTKIQVENIPAELIERDQWVCWYWKLKDDGNYTKPLIDPKTGYLASHGNPETWGTYEQAVDHYHQRNSVEGIGYVFSATDPFCGIDVDDCINPDGTLTEIGRDILQKLDSYTEISPSGTGFKVWTKGSLPDAGFNNRQAGVEMYDQLRYFTVTGNVYQGRSIINDCNGAVSAIYAKYRTGNDSTSTKENEPRQPINHTPLTDAEIIDRLKQQDFSSKLWAGDWGAYKSHSEGDFALMRSLAFWTGKDAERMIQLFRRSGLNRDKKKDGYYQTTARKAIAATDKIYESKHSNRPPEPPPYMDEPAIQTFNLTDLGNAERFATQHKNKVRFVHPWDKWLVWNGERWKPDGSAAVVRMAKDTVRTIYKEAAACQDDDTRKALAKWARTSESKAKIEAMLSLAKSEPGIPVEPQELDQNEWLLNCLNGTMNLRTGDVQPHKPGDLITKLAPVTIDPDAACPIWDEFQQRITNGNEDLIQFKQRIYGTALTGDTSDQAIFLHYGTGANGKSTELETIKAVLGDYAKQAEFSTFLVRKNETVRNDIADLRGARFVSAIEAESGQRLAESIIKQMTGGDTLKARFLFKEYFEFKPTFKIFLAANHKPVIRGTDHAIWRRIRLIPFTVTIPEEERDSKLLDKLKGELSGILNWLLIGCAEWQKNGLGISQDVKQATEAYRDEMDTLSEFISDCCLVDQQCRVTKPVLYKKYEDWCAENGEEPISKRAFRMKLIERGFQDDRGNIGRFWKGIGILERSHLQAVR